MRRRSASESRASFCAPVPLAPQARPTMTSTGLIQNRRAHVRASDIDQDIESAVHHPLDVDRHGGRTHRQAGILHDLGVDAVAMGLDLNTRLFFGTGSTNPSTSLMCVPSGR